MNEYAQHCTVSMGFGEVSQAVLVTKALGCPSEFWGAERGKVDSGAVSMCEGPGPNWGSG